MPQGGEGFWRWRLGQIRRNILPEIGGIVLMLIATANFFSKIRGQNFGILIPVLADPLFIAALVILLAALIDLDYMEFRVAQNRSQGEARTSWLRRHRVIPTLYRDLYGNDFFVKAWRWRFLYIICASLALLRWVSTWKTG